MKKFKLEANEMLHRNELKSVFGGYEYLTIGCPDDSPYECKCKNNSVTNCKDNKSDCTATCKDLGGEE